MNEYFLLKQSPKVGDVLISNIVQSPFVSNNVYNGIKFGKEQIKITVENKNGQKPDFMSGVGPYWLISEKVKFFFESLKDQSLLEFVPIQFLNLNATYFHLNILENVDCFNWERSEYTRHPLFLKELQRIPETIEKLVLEEKNINGRNIFRMDVKPVDIFISSELKHQMMKENLSGIEFTDLKNYNSIFFD